MKHSIKSIFRSIFVFNFIAIAILIFSAVILVDYQTAYKKTQNIITQKEIIFDIYSSNSGSIDIKSSQLKNHYNILKNLNELSLLDTILSNSSHNDLTKLNTLIINYIEVAKDSKNIALSQSATKLNEELDILLKENMLKDTKRLELLSATIYLLLIYVIFIAFYNRSRLIKVYEDLTYLLDTSNPNYKIFTNEADAIALRNKKQIQPEECATMIDELTGLQNHKGLLASHQSKKHLAQSSYTSVILFEIDSFNTIKNKYPKIVVDTILKKVAQTLKMYAKTTDNIAIIDSFFVLVMIRSKKDSFIDEANKIVQTISELKFSFERFGTLDLTISGGLFYKPNHMLLDDSIKEAKRLLDLAKQSGGNRIARTEDLFENELQ